MNDPSIRSLIGNSVSCFRYKRIVPIEPATRAEGNSPTPPVRFYQEHARTERELLAEKTFREENLKKYNRVRRVVLIVGVPLLLGAFAFDSLPAIYAGGALLACWMVLTVSGIPKATRIDQLASQIEKLRQQYKVP